MLDSPCRWLCIRRLVARLVSGIMRPCSISGVPRRRRLDLTRRFELLHDCRDNAPVCSILLSGRLMCGALDVVTSHPNVLCAAEFCRYTLAALVRASVPTTPRAIKA